MQPVAQQRGTAPCAKACAVTLALLRGEAAMLRQQATRVRAPLVRPLEHLSTSTQVGSYTTTSPGSGSSPSALRPLGHERILGTSLLLLDAGHSMKFTIRRCNPLEHRQGQPAQEEFGRTAEWLVELREPASLLLFEQSRFFLKHGLPCRWSESVLSRVVVKPQNTVQNTVPPPVLLSIAREGVDWHGCSPAHLSLRNPL